ncbi:hypothetical protein SUGI_0712510 [Cryptomeria japonica]|nr:hypothetical protein SUGI_0712510 [Cryptomeria japonica]
MSLSEVVVRMLLGSRLFEKPPPPPATDENTYARSPMNLQGASCFRTTDLTTGESETGPSTGGSFADYGTQTATRVSISTAGDYANYVYIRSPPIMK